jgi:hypothetical protein
MRGLGGPDHQNKTGLVDMGKAMEDDDGDDMERDEDVDQVSGDDDLVVDEDES